MVSIGSVTSSIFGGLLEDFRKKNFSLYGQWIGIVLILVALALGVANIFHASVVIVFLIICIVQGLVIVFVEMPFLLKICPLTDKFTSFIKNFDENWPRCGFYLLNAVIQWVLLVVQVTSLIVPACFFTAASFCYLMGALKHQEFLKTNLKFAAEDSVEGQIQAHVVRQTL